MAVSFRLSIESDNAAMVDDPVGEVTRILTEVAKRVERMDDHGSVSDSNGNKVGSFDFNVGLRRESVEVRVKKVWPGLKL